MHLLKRFHLAGIPRIVRCLYWAPLGLMIAGFTAEPARGVSPPSSSVGFFANDPNDYDYGLQIEIPSGFGEGEFTLEVWIDGGPVATETSSSRTDMRSFWDNWSGFPAGQEGWFWGVEKQAAIGVLSQYEDYKGLIDELRFWSRAKTPARSSPTVSNLATYPRGAALGRELPVLWVAL